MLTAAEIVAGPAVDDMDPYQYLAVAGIARTRPDMPIGVVVDGLSAGAAVGAWLTVTSGAASGRELISLGGGDDVIVAAGGRRNMSIGFEDVEPGDEIAFDNSHYLAYTHFTRHQHEDYPEFGSFTIDGAPIYPQRASATGSPDLYLVAPYRGAFDAKCIVVQNLHDGQCWPCGAQNLRRLLVERRGSARDVRVWFTEHAMHLPASALRPGPPPVASTRLIDYGGHVQQAIRDVIDWVEHDTEPPADTGFDTTDDGAIVVRDGGLGATRHPTGRARHRERRRASRRRGRRGVRARCRHRRAARRRHDRRGRVGRRRPRTCGRHMRTASTAPSRRWSCARVPSWTTPAPTSRRCGSRPTVTAMPTRAQRRLVNLGRVRVVVGRPVTTLQSPRKRGSRFSRNAACPSR